MADVRPGTQTTPQPAQRPSAAAPAPPLIRWLIRIRAFYRKEVNEIRRQPLLVLSLIGGPLLVLVLFGASFQGSNPVLRTALVLPPQGLEGITTEQIQSLAGLNFKIIDISTDRAQAEARLHAGELDVVQVLPANVFEAIQHGQSPQIEFLSNAIDPLLEGWIQYLAYAEVNEVNKAILTQQTTGAQQQAIGIKVQIADARGTIDELEGDLTQAQQAQAQENIRAFRRSLAELATRLPAQGMVGSLDVAQVRQDLARLDTNLARIEQAIDEGVIKQRLAELRATQRDLDALDGVIQIFIETPPDVVVAPVRQAYSNVRGGAYSAVVYYAPGVLALLVQHTAITLGALALVRERRMGAFEVFRVAPVNMSQLLIGKYLGYTLFIALSSTVLILMLRLLGIPLLGNLALFVALLLLLTLASLGLGFLISTVSGSDSQAIQLAMITLLLAIFFSGLFIALDSFAPPALAVSYLVPMSHGVSGFQDLMLRGLAPAARVWIALGAIAVGSFVLVVLLTRRQFQRA
jgi:ABC-2 type transport system permease protein